MRQPNKQRRLLASTKTIQARRPGVPNAMPKMLPLYSAAEHAAILGVSIDVGQPDKASSAYSWLRRLVLLSPRDSRS